MLEHRRSTLRIDRETRAIVYFYDSKMYVSKRWPHRRQNIQSLDMVTRENERKSIYSRYRPHYQGNRLFLGMVSSSNADVVSTRVTWM